jgi:hypothetical protein
MSCHTDFKRSSFIMKKFAISILAVLMLAAFAIPVSAASTYNLGPFTTPGGHNYWFSDGADDISTNLTMDMLKSASEIRLEFTEEPLGGIQFVFFGDGNEWGWTQTDLTPSGTSLVIKMSDYPGWVQAMSGEAAKIALGYWEGDLADIISSATLVYAGGGGAPVGGGVGGDVKTGVGDVAVASAIALVAAGAVIFSRKKK